MNEKITAVAVTQMFNQTSRERERLSRQNQRLCEAMVARARSRGLLRALTEGTSALATGSVLVVGAVEVMAGASTPGTVAAAMSIVGLLVSPWRDLGRVYEYWHGARVSKQKIAEFLGTPSLVVESPDAPELTPGPGRIEFQDVRVEGVLHGFSAVAAAGSVVAVVGPNGAGKSTLLALVTRLIDPDTGKVLLDTQDISRHSLASLRQAVSMVGPDLGLLRGTLDYNLRYRNPDASEEELARVCVLCGVDEIIAELPQGAQTRLTDGATNLSPGQRSRIALARALLGQPAVLILDEAESNLDPQAVQALDRVVAEYPGTVLFVTHRLERMRYADVIWHLRDGRLIEAGEPGEVLSREGPTTRFFCLETVEAPATCVKPALWLGRSCSRA